MYWLMAQKRNVGGFAGCTSCMAVAYSNCRTTHTVLCCCTSTSSNAPES